MGINAIRFTVLETVNEVMRKMGLDPVPTLITNKLATEYIGHINDVVSDLSDFGNWQETITTANVTCVSGVSRYSVQTSAVIKNVGDIYFSQRRGPLRNVTNEEYRILTRVTITGTPSQFTIFGTNSAGNPVFRVRPIPAQAEEGGIFSVLYFTKPPIYTTSDASTIIPFPSRVVVLGTLAHACLNESGGSPTDKYQMFQQQYLQSRKESLNRFNGDTGWSIDFTPGLTNRRHR